MNPTNVLFLLIRKYRGTHEEVVRERRKRTREERKAPPLLPRSLSKLLGCLSLTPPVGISSPPQQVARVSAAG
jgi:hypothetical protein